MPGHNYDLLIVDDQAGLRRLICEALIDDGYLIDQAANGLDALERLSRNKYRLILLDIKMPGMNGLETLREIRKLDSDVPVVMMTAYSELEMLQETDAEAKPVQHISKPFDLDDLRCLVKGYLSTNFAIG